MMTKRIDFINLAGMGKPILLLDTCSFLDIIRDITRETVTKSNVEASFHLLRIAEEDNGLILLMAEQVMHELNDNESSVEDEAKRSLVKFKSQAIRVNDVASLFGSQNNLDVGHLDAHVARAKSILKRWKDVSYFIPQAKGITERAYLRVTSARTPSRKGKESMKDCVVTETYLDVADKLRSLGLTSPIVFISSNTKDYYSSNTQRLSDDISDDFKKININYAPNFGAAKYLLGI
ncbi:PIN domain-containing protein [Serratia bockelmannii]|uniref:PIN domain-containing protein n=1 Tax=Serratia bockelmannii TaxID=2703793 RepID=UPI003FA69F14